MEPPAPDQQTEPQSAQRGPEPQDPGGPRYLPEAQRPGRRAGRELQRTSAAVSWAEPRGAGRAYPALGSRGHARLRFVRSLSGLRGLWPVDRAYDGPWCADGVLG